MSQCEHNAKRASWGLCRGWGLVCALHASLLGPGPARASGLKVPALYRAPGLYGVPGMISSHSVHTATSLILATIVSLLNHWNCLPACPPDSTLAPHLQ